MPSARAHRLAFRVYEVSRGSAPLICLSASPLLFQAIGRTTRACFGVQLLITPTHSWNATPNQKKTVGTKGFDQE